MSDRRKKHKERDPVSKKLKAPVRKCYSTSNPRAHEKGLPISPESSHRRGRPRRLLWGPPGLYQPSQAREGRDDNGQEVPSSPCNKWEMWSVSTKVGGFLICQQCWGAYRRSYILLASQSVGLPIGCKWLLQFINRERNRPEKQTQEKNQKIL